MTDTAVPMRPATAPAATGPRPAPRAARPAAGLPPADPEEGLEAGLREFIEELELALHQPLDPQDASALEQAVRGLHRHLRNLIGVQALGQRRAGPAGQAAAQIATQVRYLKAALADEWLLSRDWPGRALWPQHLLEAALFRSSIAGDRVLDDIEQLLADREPALRPLARLYLTALALGFQGRLRGQPDDGRLAGLRQELFQFAWQRPPGLGERDRPLDPQAYASTLSHLAARRRRGLSRWSLVWGASLLALLLCSELLWLWPTWGLRQALGELPGGPAATAPGPRATAPR
ncbi:DotU family type IV/VI secretion system protein [Ideonella livida]|uniref:DotU family type IV/VI secretion system protein n=1 Tax=Ideonella livida TaxID=2707176 RepID=A0A7C9PHC5_9BURK|nr:DotU family type IV/VI secretion system protein [Ideonella livida]NDY91352.1 DotU family type IV/VI secretion system protein [Ideonella livida]